MPGVTTIPSVCHSKGEWNLKERTLAGVDRVWMCLVQRLSELHLRGGHQTPGAMALYEGRSASERRYRS